MEEYSTLTPIIKKCSRCGADYRPNFEQCPACENREAQMTWLHSSVCPEGHYPLGLWLEGIEPL